jgi:hypothetical protein
VFPRVQGSPTGLDPTTQLSYFQMASGTRVEGRRAPIRRASSLLVPDANSQPHLPSPQPHPRPGPAQPGPEGDRASEAFTLAAQARRGGGTEAGVSRGLPASPARSARLFLPASARLRPARPTWHAALARAPEPS